MGFLIEHVFQSTDLFTADAHAPSTVALAFRYSGALERFWNVESMTAIEINQHEARPSRLAEDQPIYMAPRDVFLAR